MMSRQLQAVENEDVHVGAVGGATGSLEFKNLTQEAEYLYDDNINIQQKLKAQIEQNEIMHTKITNFEGEFIKYTCTPHLLYFPRYKIVNH